MLDHSPERFARELVSRAGRRAWIARRERDRVEVSHPWLEPAAAALVERGAWRDHEAVFLEVGRTTGALLGAFLHSTRRGQAQGGLRHWPYDRVGHFFRDGLRLSLAMTRKNALAGLHWGGGKGVIARPTGDVWRDPAWRRALYREFGAFTSSLSGCYVTAEDVGTHPSDIAEVFRLTRFVTSIPRELGGSGDPSPATASGVVCAIEAALDVLGTAGLAGRRVVVQGGGHVGEALVERLLDRGAHVVVGDTARERCAALRARFAGRRCEVREVAPGDASLLFEPCDVLSPCALGGVLGPDTIPRVRARLVCGAANGPLADEDRDDKALAERGIAFVPDFVANRLGIVACANEQYGRLPDDPELRRQLHPGAPDSIGRTTRRVLEQARRQGITPLAAANQLADRRLAEPHPLFPGRARAIVASLLAGGWHEAG